MINFALNLGSQISNEPSVLLDIPTPSPPLSWLVAYGCPLYSTMKTRAIKREHPCSSISRSSPWFSLFLCFQPMRVDELFPALNQVQCRHSGARSQPRPRTQDLCFCFCCSTLLCGFPLLSYYSYCREISSFSPLIKKKKLLLMPGNSSRLPFLLSP